MPDALNPDLDSELVIGLVGAVGAKLKAVIELLEEHLSYAGYVTRKVKVSSDVIQATGQVSDHEGDPCRRISDLMDEGNTIRRKTGNNGFLALGVANQIYSLRKKDPEGVSLPQGKTAIIVDSLKRPEEVHLLRKVYPSGFVLVGVHEVESRRRANLIKKRMSKGEAENLITRDGEEVGKPYGQRLKKTFYLADFFVQITNNNDRLEADVRRMVELWFGNPFITPTFDEYAMFMAFASGLRSADLSRQVGAVVARDEQILSTGANDCPKAGGGLYWPKRGEKGTIKDAELGRDYMRGHDSNRAEQLRIVKQLVDVGEKEHGIDRKQLEKLLLGSRIGDLTEFGRMVHAEMDALMGCARAGISTQDSMLYCTTFPCHNCAKHIIASGIKRVVFVEPYPKSKALEFHDDSIRMSGDDESEDKFVEFEPFVGIGPRRFFDLFSVNLTSSYELTRKSPTTGKKQDWSIQDSRLRIQMPQLSYLDFEMRAVALFDEQRAKNDKTEEPNNDK